MKPPQAHMDQATDAGHGTEDPREAAAAARRAFEDVVRPHLEYLYAYGVRLSGDRAAAEDLVQETLLRAYRGFGGLRDPDRPRLWLTRILTNAYHDRHRADPHAAATLSLDDDDQFDLFDKITEEDPLPYSDRVHLDFLDLFDDARLLEVLQGLAPLPRTALILAYVYGYQAHEIAEVVNRPLGTVLSWLHRGRKQLERKLWDHAVRHNLIRRESPS